MWLAEFVTLGAITFGDDTAAKSVSDVYGKALRVRWIGKPAAEHGQLPLTTSGEIEAPELLMRDVPFQDDQRILP